jgi:alkylation response protein AidB-like acyl-CoA dehydrogenase
MGREEVEGGVIRAVYADLWPLGPLHPFLPHGHGGQAGQSLNVLAHLDATAYEHLPMSLSIALTGALFILPVARLGEPTLARDVLSRFTGPRVHLGGMMMTEPTCGTDLFSARTTATPNRQGYRLCGEKHWSGLTGHADHWLVFAKTPSARRSGRFGFFIARGNGREGSVEVLRFYEALGLAPIPYGHSRVDAQVPEVARIGYGQAYPSVVANVLKVSRLTFAGMAHGFILRVLDEARRQTTTRSVSGRYLSTYDQVQVRLRRIQFAELVTRVLCRRIIHRYPTLAGSQLPPSWEACLVKALSTELMALAANELSVLAGAEGFRVGGTGFRFLVDAHPFRIFEGPNDVLFEQIGRHLSRAAGSANLADILDHKGGPPQNPLLQSLVEGVGELDRQGSWVAAGRVLSLAQVLVWAKDLRSDFSAQEQTCLDWVGRSELTSALTTLLGQRYTAAAVSVL